MNFGVKRVAPTGWRYEGWRNCADLTRPGMEGVPRYLRCMRCYRLVTHGETRLGSCICGFRKLNPALSLTWPEILLLKLGWFPLERWEREEVKPIFPHFWFPVRNKFLRHQQIEGNPLR